VALIPPVLPGVAAGRLGYNNGYPDSDGVLRHYRFSETLVDGGVIQSIALSVARTLHPERDLSHLAGTELGSRASSLLVWPARSGAHARVSFADVFDAADGKPVKALPSFAGKVVIIGSTAPSLHDVHPTPLSAMQPGVESLATAIDNALNGRHLLELPRTFQAMLAVLLVLSLAAWVQWRSLSSLDPLLLPLPIALLLISFASLHGLPIFLELQLVAGLALAFLAVLRYWTKLRRDHWCAPPVEPLPEGWALAAVRGREPWADQRLDQLIDVMERIAPDCRLVAGDATARWPSDLRWPEMALQTVIFGPADRLRAAVPELQQALAGQLDGPITPTDVPAHTTRAGLVSLCHHVWVRQDTPGAST
jgi:hypothetical protein